MRREGLDPEIKLISVSEFYPSYLSSDDEKRRTGFGIFFERCIYHRFSWSANGFWKFSGRPRFKKDLVEKWNMLIISIFVGNKQCDIALRLTKAKGE